MEYLQRWMFTREKGEGGREGGGGEGVGGREEATIREVDVCESINTMNLLPQRGCRGRKEKLPIVVVVHAGQVEPKKIYNKEYGPKT